MGVQQRQLRHLGHAALRRPPNNWGYIPQLQALERNNYRMGNYHRLDLSANLHVPINPGALTFNLSVYNVYNHNNPFIVYTDYKWDAATQQEKKVLKQVSIFPIIPSLSVAYKF